MCVVAADVEFDEISNVRNDYKVGRIFRFLEREEKLKFPHFARLERLSDEEKSAAKWKLNETAAVPEDVDRVSKLHARVGDLLHEKNAYEQWPSSDESASVVFSVRKYFRAEHQWLWNRFWQHSNRLNSHLFFINLDDASKATKPATIKVDKLTTSELVLDLSPDLVADFTGEIDWTEFEE